jgi:predicted transcriptional regulator/DNA-binding HxlR family transcriptional regulator
MKTQETVTNQENTEKYSDFAQILRALDEQCQKCKPVTPLECISRCKTWKLKNELRRLNETMENPNFMKDLMNVLKNDTRLHILQTIAKNHYSVSKLQQELKKTGHIHSQDTITEEYLRPLLKVGLAEEAQDQYCATTFGGRLTDLIGDYIEIVNFLPMHSECHEETILKALLVSPKTFEDMNDLVSKKIVSRILRRLKTAELIETPKEKDYVFFFPSKRDPEKEDLSPTESKVYNEIVSTGISAKKLADKTALSIRRTYKYIRKLKGKKLVFTRRTPKTYNLTTNGEKLATLLIELNNLVEETLVSSQQFIKGNENN